MDWAFEPQRVARKSQRMSNAEIFALQVIQTALPVRAQMTQVHQIWWQITRLQLGILPLDPRPRPTDRDRGDRPRRDGRTPTFRHDSDLSGVNSPKTPRR